MTERARTLKKKSFFLISLLKNTGPDSLRAARSCCFKNNSAKLQLDLAKAEIGKIIHPLGALGCYRCGILGIAGCIGALRHTRGTGARGAPLRLPR